MAFFCAGSSSKTISTKHKGKGSNSKPQPMPNDLNNMNGRVALNPPSPPSAPLPTIPHSDTVDLPHKRKMIVVQEYVPQDAKGLPVHRGDSVQVISQEGEWLYVRNERGKEGFVPTSHLLAPYSATRTRLGSRSAAIRHVASGDSVSSLEPSPKLVPMYASHSAGRPRGKSAERDKENHDNRVNGMKKAVSPPATTLAIAHDISNNNSNPNMMTSSYEQKHSPSSSSGVTSMNDPSSPSFSSLHQSSQENVGHHTSSSSLNHSQHDHSTTSSRSSIENETPRLNGVDHFDIPTMKTGPTVSEEMLSRNGRATSESRKPHLLPPRHDQMPVTRRRRTQHIYSEVEIRDDGPPPPIPPRNLPLIEETYSNPIDACNHEPVFNYPRVQSLTDVSDKMKHVKSDGVYSSVFQNGTATMTKPSHRRATDATPEIPSKPKDGNLVPSRRSSKKSGSRNHLHGDSYLEGPNEKLPKLLLNRMENREVRPALHPLTKICKFRKCLWGLFIVLEDFEGCDEDEVTVKAGEHVSVWNQDDRDWYWIVKHASNESEEGFVPSSVLREIVSTDSKCIPGYEGVVHQNGVSTSSAASPKQLSTDHSETRHRSGSQERRNRSGSQEWRNRSGSQEQRNRSGSQEGRHRSGSQETRYRSGSQEGRRRLGSQDGRTGMRVRPGSGGYMGRRGSDSSSSRSGSHLVRTPSSSSIEKVEIPDSPPSSPPPPYSVHDNVRHFSLSQQQESNLDTYTTHMHRTRSQGYVAPRTYLPRVQANARLREQRGRDRRLGNVVSPPPIDSGTLV